MLVLLKRNFITRERKYRVNPDGVEIPKGATLPSDAVVLREDEDEAKAKAKPRPMTSKKT